jgi:hypothetical protein
MCWPCTSTDVGAFACIVVSLLALLTPGAVGADPLESLLSPGPVVEAHADVEAECGSCHQPFRKEIQARLCLVCHEEVSIDLKLSEGYHGLSSARDEPCSSCHGEHLGRDADILGLDPETFDHSLTDFPLHGRHRGADCAGCHAADEPYRGAPSECAACHGEEDPHRGRLGEACGDCHSVDGWRSAEFDHDKTSFPLIGKHIVVDCASCHVNERYEATPKDCYACHRVNDVHLGRFGGECSSCHTPAAWDSVEFDHAADTRFPLRGAHRSAECRECHTGDLYADPAPRDCFSCHRTDDEHKGRFGKACETCHAERSWKADHFDHETATDFPLRGRHREVDCVACHTSVIGDEKLPSDCRSCHESDDVHLGQEGPDCARCHRESGWREHVFFDHDLTTFPLLGLHAITACEECHASAAFQDAPESCDSCHRAEDYHEGRLGASCEPCHNPNSWRLWRFDHDTETRFPLEGAHADQHCHGCHARPVEGEIRLPQTCVACHERDDVHLGSYGRSCSRCHSTDAWSRVRTGP